MSSVRGLRVGQVWVEVSHELGDRRLNQHPEFLVKGGPKTIRPGASQGVHLKECLFNFTAVKGMQMS